LKTLLRKDWIQRTIYLIGLLILVLLSFKDGTGTLNQESSLGIKYIYFFIVPFGVLLFQIIFNKLYGWFGIAILFCLYFIWFIISVITGVKEKAGYFAANDCFVLFVILLVLLLFGYFLYLIKPQKK